MTDRLQTRSQLEENERRRLAPYAVTALGSRGREYPEDEHLFRTCFQRDRDRVIHCAAFRRLDAKTQVFLDTAGDYYRTRLTHTLEVAQIARTLARILSVNEDLAEAAALAHDLGHPPYGHAGEVVLNELMANHDGFEHNRQSLRVVEYLEHPYPNFRGLNLTWETRECLAKHETRYDQPEGLHQFSPGFAPLEGQIADLADAIAYNSHDLDDALACDLICEEDLDAVVLYEQLRQRIDRQFPRAHRHARQLRCAKALIDLLISDALEESSRCLDRRDPPDVDHVRSSPIKLVALSPERQSLLEQLERFLLETVYHHPQVVRAQQQARDELSFLFYYFQDDPDRLPSRYRQRIERQALERVICDYLAGMTDRYCHGLYRGNQ